MADFCGKCDMGDDHPLGDFKWVIEALKDGRLAPIDPGYFYNVGICEGHGSSVMVVKEDDGSWALHHGEGFDCLRGVKVDVPGPVRIEL